MFASLMRTITKTTTTIVAGTIGAVGVLATGIIQAAGGGLEEIGKAIDNVIDEVKAGVINPAAEKLRGEE